MSRGSAFPNRWWPTPASRWSEVYAGSFGEARAVFTIRGLFSFFFSTSALRRAEGIP
jgi:hypothetical protein